MNRVVLLVLLVLAATGLVFGEEMKKADDGAMMKKTDDSAMMKKDSSMMDGAMDSPFGSLKGLGSQILGFTTEKNAMELAKTQTVVYFFAASWCPDCKATFKDIKANFAMVPKTTTIIVIDYDKSAELKKKYGITKQHTFVVVDAQGMKKSIWNGAMTVKDILSKSSSMM